MLVSGWGTLVCSGGPSIAFYNDVNGSAWQGEWYVAIVDQSGMRPVEVDKTGHIKTYSNRGLAIQRANLFLVSNSAMYFALPYQNVHQKEPRFQSVPEADDRRVEV